MNQILEAYKNYLLEKYGGRTENEIWLQRINEIPHNERKLIRCGGYGNVYTVKESNDNVYALKLVEGFGGLDSYQSQVNALENEYWLMISNIFATSSSYNSIFCYCKRRQ